MTTKPTIGIDISKDHLDACRWPDGETCRVGNDAKGHRQLITWIGAEVDRVAFEGAEELQSIQWIDCPTHGAYHGALERALHRAGIPYAKLNPARVRRFAEAVGTQAKTDRADASLIARMGALLQPAAQAPRSQALADLHELELARAALNRERTAAKNRAGRLTLALLRRQHAARLRTIERARSAEILCSIPCLAPVTAAAILAEVPELGTLEPGAVASLAGLAPFTRQSGRWKGAAKIGGGRAELRRALYMPALTAARFNPDLKAVYDRLRAAGKPAKVALVAVMRKLLILANALIRDDREWSPTRP